ncbi:unnamed protein product [Aureobasidium vineae]|uniref:Diaminopimelate epimerase-like protein n=1 Tax=Aureobasidium vineae TaxID=2773715 RepID=A0A9N8JER2_9PEZI|nr:unnamed protein product [Aureobasidium vineae]
MARYLEFVYLDVFTTTPFKGNPLAIVHLPQPTASQPALTQAQKQTIARELNLSETVFIHDLDEAEDGGLDSSQRKIDIFMPTLELPFAGHPTGPIAIHANGPGQVGISIPHNTHLHLKRMRDLSSSLQATGLHSDAAILEAEIAAPIFSIVDGMNFGLIKLQTLEELSLVYPGPSAFSTASKLLDAGWLNTYMARYYYVVLSSTSVSSSSRHVALRTRMMEKSFEDPATGAAAGALGSYYALYECTETEVQIGITQGVEFGRRSDIDVYVAVGIDGEGKRFIQEISLGGTAAQSLKEPLWFRPSSLTLVEENMHNWFPPSKSSFDISIVLLTVCSKKD